MKREILCLFRCCLQWQFCSDFDRHLAAVEDFAAGALEQGNERGNRITPRFDVFISLLESSHLHPGCASNARSGPRALVGNEIPTWVGNMVFNLCEHACVLPSRPRST